YAWGSNSCGQLGIGSVQDQFVPKEVGDIQRYYVASIAAGGEHSIMAISWGRVVSFGSNAVGQLGIGRNNQGRDVIRCSPSI
ncbi:conserved hypothetical protein, partial [Perkinsus marinus ATCC 50983]